MVNGKAVTSSGVSGGASIIALERFIQATRDSGYKSTVSAICELVDNSLEAGARRIEITVSKAGDSTEYPLQVKVLDDGEGMDRATLQEALRFGGSSRFNSRRGLGRYGMGLPNSSISQARRLEVHTWRAGATPLYTYIDVDEIAEGRQEKVPAPRKLKAARRAGVVPEDLSNGTLVSWLRCDRLDNKRINTIVRKLHLGLGRVFRYFLWDGVELLVNDKPVKSADPLFLEEDSAFCGAEVHFEKTYQVRLADGSGKSPVLVRFTRLPLGAWHDLSNEEKRFRGISNGAGVSIIRGKREVEYGWLLLGSKRRENYDDWWRCEVRFEPALDEDFGITHTKQQIRPSTRLQEVLACDLGQVAKDLNRLVRDEYRAIKEELLGGEPATCVTVAHDELGAEWRLHSACYSEEERKKAEALVRRHPPLRSFLTGAKKVQLVVDSIYAQAFYSPIVLVGSEGQEPKTLAVINPEHQFYKEVLQPLEAARSNGGSLDGHRERLGQVVELLLETASVTELKLAEIKDDSSRRIVRSFRKDWSALLDRSLQLLFSRNAVSGGMCEEKADVFEPSH